MPRVGLDAEAVVAAAAALADADGLEAVTLARVAHDLGVRPPSLYVHIGGLGDLRQRIGTLGAGELAAALSAAAAGRAGRDALDAVAQAYRGYARAHPGRYAALHPARDSPEARAVVDVVVAVLRGYGLEGALAIHAVRTIRAALHGFVSLEADAGFGMPLSVDESFDKLVTVLDKGLEGVAS